MIQIHPPPAHAGRWIFRALFRCGAESVIGGAEIADAPQAFGLDRWIGGARQPLIAGAGAGIAMVTERLARQDGGGSGWNLGSDGKYREKPKGPKKRHR
jgi:hypothetical protein